MYASISQFAPKRQILELAIIAPVIPLTIAVVYDLRTMKLPNFWLLFSLVVGIAAQVGIAIFQNIPLSVLAWTWLWASMRLVGIFLALMLFRKVARGGFGMGDVKMAAVCAFFLDLMFWLGMMIAACLVALVWVGIRDVVKRLKPPQNGAHGVSERIAFGPFMYIGYVCLATLQILT